MSANRSNDFNKEYMYVRRLIGMLTNDDSDKPIVEKLKGKNLTSLLYNAKIISDNKNVANSKMILACVIRAMEREKHMQHKRELEQSWGRKFLNSLNCLYPGMVHNEEYERSLVSKSSLRQRRPSYRMVKHQAHSRGDKASTRTPRTSCRSGTKNGGASSVRCGKPAADMENRDGFQHHSFAGSIRNKTYSCIESILTSKQDDGDWGVGLKVGQHLAPVVLTLMSQKMAYETIRPPMLRQRKLRCFMIYPGRALPAMKRLDRVEKTSSSTQTADSSYGSDPLLSKLPNNVRLQDLLEAASSLINTDAQREYVRDFLKNFEPPFDLSDGFPPYVKLPMEKAYVAGEESVYGTNSELSLMSVLPAPTANDIIRQKEENVRRYVRDLMNDPWQDAAESIISGVINESLPHNKADYSKLGACILKRLGAYPESCKTKESRSPQQNLSIPELILQCTEYFENDANDAEKKAEVTDSKKQEIGKDSDADKAQSIVEISLAEEREAAKPLNSPCIQNYCFHEGDNQKIGILNLSETSLVGIGTYQAECKEPCKSELAGQGDGSKDRKYLQFREALKITPSGLEQGGKKSKKSILDWRGGSKGKTKTEPRRVQAERAYAEQNTEDRQFTDGGRAARQKVSIYTVSSGKNHQEPLIQLGDSIGETEAMDGFPTLKPDSAVVMEPSPAPNLSTNTDQDPHIQKAMPPEIIETDTPPPELAQPRRERQAAEPETFEGVGEDQGSPTEPPTNKHDKKHPQTKNQERVHTKKRCNMVPKKKAHLRKHDDPSRNCKVM